MKYVDFVKVMSSARMHRYYVACGNDSRKAMTLYRKNLQLSQEMFTVISCSEVALRNKINDQYVLQHGANWIRDSVTPTGFFSSPRCIKTKSIILKAQKNLAVYTHPKITFLFWFWFLEISLRTTSIFRWRSDIVEGFSIKANKYCINTI